MIQTGQFAIAVFVVGMIGIAAVLSHWITARIRVPVPALVLISSAIAVRVMPGLHEPPELDVERIVTVALLFILFDGGMHIGWRRFRTSATPIGVVGILGTFLTAAGGAILLHLIFGFPWFAALLVATAVAPTDPAVVFSVLGQREIAGRSSTILEGESGANDPVGIALMASLLAVGKLTGGAFGTIGLQFVLQMVVGGALGFFGGRLLLAFMRRVTLPSEALYPVRTLLWIPILYGVAVLAQGSGFLAVFVAGIVIGDADAPYKREIGRFHSAVASLSEIAAFAVLGLTVDLNVLARTSVWLPGLALAVVLAIVIRPVFVGLCLIPVRLRQNERVFVLFAGLKGAVPILLGELLRTARVPDADELYGIVIIVVAFSVVVQATLTPAVASRLKLPMQAVHSDPWAIGVQLRAEPMDAHQLRVAKDSVADGRSVDELDLLGEQLWISFVVRDRQLVALSGKTILQAGDEITILADKSHIDRLKQFFTESDPT